jgi:hypothetical protein
MVDRRLWDIELSVSDIQVVGINGGLMPTELFLSLITLLFNILKSFTAPLSKRDIKLLYLDIR